MSTIQYNTIQWRWGLLLHHLFWYFKSRLFCSVPLQSQPDCVAGTKLLFPLFILAKQKSEGLANARCGCLVIGCFMCVQGFPFGIIPHTIYNICSMLVCILLYYYMHLNMDDILHWSTRMSLKPNKMYQQQQQQKNGVHRKMWFAHVVDTTAKQPNIIRNIIIYLFVQFHTQMGSDIYGTEILSTFSCTRRTTFSSTICRKPAATAQLFCDSDNDDVSDVVSCRIRHILSTLNVDIFTFSQPTILSW